jgi:hypothetical protein
LTGQTVEDDINFFGGKQYFLTHRRLSTHLKYKNRDFPSNKWSAPIETKCPVDGDRAFYH